MTKNIKLLLQQAMYQKIDVQMQSLQAALKSIEESKQNETKSSAGDKYETGRAMMQMEQDKINAQFSQLMATKNHLQQISVNKESIQGEIGAIIGTEKENYYISVGLGKIELDGQMYYTISPEAPLSKLMINKSIGDNVTFGNRSFEIFTII